MFLRSIRANSVAAVTGNTSPTGTGGSAPGQGRKPQPVGGLVADLADLAAQDRVLVPDHQQLGPLKGFGPPGGLGLRIRFHALRSSA
jgi:hypothetical protein